MNQKLFTDYLFILWWGICMLKNLFSTRKASTTTYDELILDKVFSGSITISEPRNQDAFLPEEKKALIRQLIELSSKEYKITEPKIIMSSLDYTLYKKKERERSLENYELALKRNTVFFLYKWGYSKKLLKAWIDFGSIPNHEAAEKQLTTLREFCLIENVGGSFVLKNKRKIQPDIVEAMKKYDNISLYPKKIKELEYSYKYTNVRDDIALNLLLNIVNNKQIAEDIFKGVSSDKVISYMEYLIDCETSYVLGNI